MSAHTPDDATPIRDREQLVEFMLSRVKPRDGWLIGTEHEKFGFSLTHMRRPHFTGEIEALFLALEGEGWRAQRESSGAIISLHQNQASITLEPGGQLELSGAPLRSLHETQREVTDHLELIGRLSRPLGLIWCGLGSDPTRPEDTPKMPKARYQVMRNYLPTRGDLALHMMHATSTIQTNLDYSSEADAMRKLRASLYLQPIVMAMFANSFTLDGELWSGSCARSSIWLRTDPDRYLYPKRWLDPDATLREYVDWALKVPMFFIARDGEYLDCAGLPFDRFMREGTQGQSATMGDFELHLSTLFPDARLKQHLEVRGADMSSSEYVTALSAFHVGLLYDDLSLDRTLELFDGVPAETLWSARAQLNHLGLKTLLGERSLGALALTLLELSAQGLARYEPGAERYLDPLIERIARGEVPADEHRARWSQGYRALMEGAALTT